ncbi:MAG: hypothetical protein Q7S74_06180 [Nanoarchaeota archaeon]|nr:hypothetical protein [Nanoarchaeota archaeon]
MKNKVALFFVIYFIIVLIHSHLLNRGVIEPFNGIGLIITIVIYGSLIALLPYVSKSIKENPSEAIFFFSNSRWIKAVIWIGLILSGLMTIIIFYALYLRYSSKAFISAMVWLLFTLAIAAILWSERIWSKQKQKKR